MAKKINVANVNAESSNVSQSTSDVFKTTSLFSAAEKSYCEMLADGILVDDKWFAKDSTEIERARYHTSFLCRQERNRRRREHRKSLAIEHKPRPSAKIISQAPESREMNRRPLERRKCIRRSTIAACPTVSEIRTAWQYRNSSPQNKIRLGGLLMDLECYLDNSLIRIVINKRLKIIGRRGGLHAWIRENCPELEAHYKSLQRFKGMAKRLRQELDVVDPVSITTLLDSSISDEILPSAEIHVQPRGTAPAQINTRFPWEKSETHFDADGRIYLENENYYLANSAISPEITENLAGYRSLLRVAISLNDKAKCTIETYCYVGQKDDRDAGIAAGIGEMFMYIGRHPEFLVEAGRQMVRDVASGVGEMMLPERTVRRIRDGERVGLGRIALDVAGAYMQFYNSCLVYRWNKTPIDQILDSDRITKLCR